MSTDKFHLFVIDKMFGADQREAQRRRRDRACHFLVCVNPRGSRPGLVQAERSEPLGSLDGWPRSIQSRWRKWQATNLVFPIRFPGRCCFDSIRISFNVRKTTADLSPSFHPHSSLSIYLLGASWAFLVSVGAAT
jgi:hypothetical protein